MFFTLTIVLSKCRSLMVLNISARFDEELLPYGFWQNATSFPFNKLFISLLTGNGYLSAEEMRTVLTSCLEESKLKFDDQQVDELMEVFFEEIETNAEGEIGLDQFKSFLSKYPGVSENLSIR